jgi:hypothetical protein
MWQKKIRGRIFYFARWGRRIKGKMERLDNDGWQEASTFTKPNAMIYTLVAFPGISRLVVCSWAIYAISLSGQRNGSFKDNLAAQEFAAIRDDTRLSEGLHLRPSVPVVGSLPTRPRVRHTLPRPRGVAAGRPPHNRDR